MNTPTQVRMAPVSVDAVDALLPQTQCRQCGYAGCRPYAEAIRAGRADINQCPPGGEGGIRDLAALLGVPFKPLNPQYGITKPPAVAVIDEQMCIGCTLCIQVCPVDAIIGAAKRMHTVIAQECTGCELCIPPCPVDCISMQESGRQLAPEEGKTAAALARLRHESRTRRLQRDKRERAARPAAARGNAAEHAAERKKRAAIEKAIARAAVRLQQRGN